MRKSAIISDCGLYRYELRREWDDALPPMVMIMLNPSTADAENDDPTIRRCISRAVAEGCGSLIVVNLGAGRATEPKNWKAMKDPVGPECHSYIRKAINEARFVNGKIVAAWGNHGSHLGLSTFWRAACQGDRVPLWCFGITKSGEPKHPLYISSATPLFEFTRGLA